VTGAPSLDAPRIEGRTGTVVLSALLALLAGFFVYFPITDSDIFWHLASAREMVHRGGFLYADPFSYTPHVARWINVHWLFQLCVLGVWKIAGYHGIVLVKCTMTGITAAVLLHAIPDRARGVPAAAFIALLLFQARYLVLERPTVVTVLLVALYVWSLERWVITHQRRYLWWMLPAQVVWVNMQGLFVLGPVIASAYWLGDAAPGYVAARMGGHAQDGLPPTSIHRSSSGVPARAETTGTRPAAISVACSSSEARRFRLFTAACVGLWLAAFVNPYGWRMTALPLKLFSRIAPTAGNPFSTGISENIPMPGWWAHDAGLLVTVLALAALVVVSFAANLRAFRYSHALLCAGFFALAFMAQRNALLFCVVAAPVVLHNFGSSLRHTWWSGASRQWVRVGAVVTGVVVVGCAVWTHARIVAPVAGSALSPFRFPVEAVDVLKAHPVPGRMFNADRYGGYVLWHLFPEEQVFIDGRFMIRSPAFLRDFFTMLEHPQLFDGVADNLGITHALLQTTVFDLYLPLARHLYENPRWHLTYADGASALFVRDSLSTGPGLRLDAPATADSIAASLDKRWQHLPQVRSEALARFAAFLDAMGETREATSVRLRMMQPAN